MHPSPTASGIVHVEALGQSDAFLKFNDQLSRVAPVNRPILLIGERGTGKELAAGRLHYLSPRWRTELVTLNCAALTPSLIEAELFGYEKGAFTGALQQRAGRFEAADGGTLFLDEIGNIPLQVQAKVLRVVEYGIFERVGGIRSVEVDVRIIGATNADLAAMADDGRFKPDLLDRLAFEILVVPPLRERAGDIDLLADQFSAKMSVELGLPFVPAFSQSARKQLREYHWPGNIRELKNVIERAVYRNRAERITHIEIDPFAAARESIKAGVGPSPNLSPVAPPTSLSCSNNQSLDQAVSTVEIQMLRQALQKTKFNQKKAARLLGLSYDRLRGLIRKHGDRLGG